MPGCLANLLDANSRRRPWESGARLLSLLALAALLPLPASAHEVHHQVERSRAVAVRAAFEDGTALAGATFEVFSPEAPRTPYQTGRTDRHGWAAFVPDAPGSWRVRVVDDTGHGTAVYVEVNEDGVRVEHDHDHDHHHHSPLLSLARPLLGVGILGALFGALYWRHRRRSEAPKA